MGMAADYKNACLSAEQVEEVYTTLLPLAKKRDACAIEKIFQMYFPIVMTTVEPYVEKILDKGETTREKIFASILDSMQEEIRNYDPVSTSVYAHTLMEMFVWRVVYDLEQRYK